uniref:Nucleoporin NSP1 n=1 Tax=Bionectria ochroleuca TaxID=29856 RepID=A0A8H7TPE9_BIOOC
MNKPTAPTTAAAPGGLFGANKPAAPAATSGGLFPTTSTTTASAPDTKPAAPAAGGLFGAKPAAAATSTPAAAPAGGLFGGASAQAPSATPAAPASTNLFAAKPPAASTAAPAAPAATSTSLFGTKPAGEASSSKPTSSLFGTPAASSQPAATTATTTAAPATLGAASMAPAGSAAPAAATSSLFGAKPASTPVAGAAGNDKPADAAKPSTPAPGSSALGASTTGPTSQIARLKNKTMEDIVTRWASDLSKYQKEFKDQATVVSNWDRQLVDNGEKIQKLYLDTFEAERASHEIERQLSSVEGQQDELEAWLDRYESELQDMFAKQIGTGEQLAGPDQERERTYKLAEKLTQQLDEKSRDLSKMVKEINDISGTLSKGAKPEDPLSQIVRVLNGHLTQLQWIDANASQLQTKVAAAQKASHNLGSHYGVADNDAAESFYRSYMGR